MFSTDVRFTDYVSLTDWQGMQDSLAEALEVTLRTSSPDGSPLTRTSRANQLCEMVVRRAPAHSRSYVCCTVGSEARNLRDIKKDTNLKCPFDLDLFVVPIKAVGDRIVAYLILGPMMLKNRKEISYYAAEAKKHGISPEELEDALIEIHVFSYNKVNAINQLIKAVFSHMAQTGYHKKRLGELAPEVRELDPVFSRYYEEKILGALLNTCALALNADSGSVMTLDKKTNMLHIKVASKLDDEVVNNTNIKIGEGIAGLAAATSESIVLPKDERKNGLAKKMKRKYIKSSLIMPFNKGATHDVYGVLNLNVMRKRVEFSEKDIALVKELVKLASIALIPLSQAKDEADKATQ